jgi:hypothetical protein
MRRIVTPCQVTLLQVCRSYRNSTVLSAVLRCCLPEGLSRIAKKLLSLQTEHTSIHSCNPSKLYCLSVQV